jgi:hypothetical protein
MFQKEFYNIIPSVTAWRMLRKRLNKLFIVQGVERWIAYTPLSANVTFVTITKLPTSPTFSSK